MARKVIYWVFYAVRPLTLEEIQHALAAEPYDTSLEEDSIIDEELLVSVCTGIITVQHQSDVVGLVHYTAQEYLERKAVVYFPEAQHDIVRTCLTYLSFEEFEKGPCRNNGKLKARLKAWPLLRYAAHHWAAHASTKEPYIQDTRSSNSVALKPSGRRVDYSFTRPRLEVPASQAAILLRDRGIKYSNNEEDESSSCGVFIHSDSQTDSSSSQLSSPEASNIELILRFLNQGSKMASFIDIAALKRDRRGSGTLAYIQDFPSNLPALCLCAFLNLNITARYLLHDDVSASTKDDYGRTPLHYSTLKGHQMMTRLLLENGAEIAASAQWGSAPLHQAARGGHEAVLRMLIDNGADVAAEDVHGFTPLHVAVSLGHYAATVTLLDSGADVNALVRAKEAPLHMAIGNSSNSLTQLLLERGAYVDAKDSNGKTPLHMTVMDRNLPNLLLRYGANLSIEDNNGLTVLHLAARYGQRSIMTQFLLESGAETEARDDHGRTPLHDAAQFGHTELTKSLIKGGASIDAQDNQGMTALHHAATFEYDKVMQILLDYGANIGSKDHSGKSAIDVAIDLCNKSGTRLLLRNGADIIGPSGDWGIVLQAAAQRGDEGMIRLLLDFGADIDAFGGHLS